MAKPYRTISKLTPEELGNPMPHRYVTEACCIDCSVKWWKRSDTFKAWSGRCGACALKELRRRANDTPRGGSTKAAWTRTNVEVICVDCSAKFRKRSDSLKDWNGRCKGCASKELAKRPEMQSLYKRNGLDFIARFGQVPNAKKFTKEYSGSVHHNWRGGITPENVRIRQSEKMKTWRLAVFERDDHTCVICKKRGGDKHADHIQPFALFPDLRFDVSNGRTLCASCHRKYGACVNKGKITRPSSLG